MYDGDAQAKAHEEILSLYWANSTHDGWRRVTSEELTLCFAMGMSLNWHILKSFNKKKEEGNRDGD